MSVHVCVHPSHGIHMEIREQFVRIGSLLLPRGSRGLNSDLQVQWQVQTTDAPCQAGAEVFSLWGYNLSQRVRAVILVCDT